jgi:prepilin peptidase dependent protein B
MHRHPGHRHRVAAPSQAGLSLVELLIAMALGLFIVGAALGTSVMQLKASQTLVAQSRLVLDLRTATDLITRDLRRAGYWGAAEAGVWRRSGVDAAATAPASNPYSTYTADAAPASVTYGYSRDATENHLVDPNEHFGYRLRRGAIEMQLGRDNWQALTDSTSVNVTRLTIAPTEQLVPLDALCNTPCPPDSTTCPPQQRVRSVSVTVSARSTSNRSTDASTERTVQTLVRLRNDAITGACPD